MSDQKEIKESLINFQIRAVDLLRSSINAHKELTPDQQNLGFKIHVEQKLDNKNQCLIVVTNVDILIAENVEETLASCSVACVYSIANFSDVVKADENNKVTIHPGVIDILNSISLSTTRGVFSQIVRGTYLHGAVLPIVDPKSFNKP